MNLLLLELALVAVLGVPGPTNALLFAAGALRGVGRALPLILAEATGYLLSIGLLKALGQAMIAGDARIGLTLRLLLGAYLLFLAWQLWRLAPAPSEADPRVVTARRVFVATLLNPKGLVLAFAVLPPFDSVRTAFLAGTAFLATLAASAFAWIAIGAVLAHGRQGPVARLVPRLAALAVGAFAAYLAGTAVATRL
jgi:threonine/homoserine/homoserine lactone efflux protein